MRKRGRLNRAQMAHAMMLSISIAQMYYAYEYVWMCSQLDIRWESLFSVFLFR